MGRVLIALVIIILSPLSLLLYKDEPVSLYKYQYLLREHLVEKKSGHRTKSAALVLTKRFLEKIPASTLLLCNVRPKKMSVGWVKSFE